MKTVKDYNSLISLIEGIVRKQLLMEGGAGGHMQHPFDIVKDGPALKEKFIQIGKEIEGGNLPDTKIDGTNTSIKAVNTDEGKRFAMDRGTGSPLDVKGTTVGQLLKRFTDFITIEPSINGKSQVREDRIIAKIGPDGSRIPYKWQEKTNEDAPKLKVGDKVIYKPHIDPKKGPPKPEYPVTIGKIRQHGMVPSYTDVLNVFNGALPEIEPELKKLGLDDPTKYFNMEYVKDSPNVVKYDHDFLKIHGVNQFYEKKDEDGKLIRPGLPRPKGVAAAGTPVSYDREAMNSLVEKLKEAGDKHGFKVYSIIPSKKTGDFNFNSADDVPVPVTLSVNNVDDKSLLDRLNVAKGAPAGRALPITIWYSNFREAKKKAKKEGRDLTWQKFKETEEPTEETLKPANKKHWPPVQGKEIYKAVLGTSAADIHVDPRRQIPLDLVVAGGEAEQQKAIDGAVMWHATRLLGNVIMDNMEVDHPAVSGPANKHEGLVIRLAGDERDTKITGEFILGGEATAFRAVAKEGPRLAPDPEPEGEEKALSFVFIPGGFKPPHKGHISLIKTAVEQNPGARIIILSGKEARGQVTAEKAEKIFLLFLKHVGLKTGMGPGEVQLEYFDPVATGKTYIKGSKSGKAGEPIMTSSPMVKIGEIAVKEAENGAKIVIISSKADESYSEAFNNILTYAAEKAGKTFEIETLALKTEDVAPGIKISATDMRRSALENDFEKFKQFLPDGFPEDEARVVFQIVGGQFEPEQPEQPEEPVQPVQPQEPQTDMDEASGAGAGFGGSIQGAAGRGRRYRFVRGVLQKESTMKGTIYNMQESKLTREEDVLKEFLVERFIKQYKAEDLLKEGPGERVKSTFGVAQMTQGLNKILDQVYNQHYFNLDLPEQREAFIAHFIEYAMMALAQVDVLLRRRRENGGEEPAEEAAAAVEAAAADIEVGDEAAEAIAEEPAGATELEEAAPEGEEEIITLDIEDNEKEEEKTSAEDILSGKKLPELTAELPPEIASMNAQGAAQAQLAFHNNGKQLIDAYRGIVDPNPNSPNYEKELEQAQNYREGFKDSFLTNFGLWSDRWKIQTDSTAQARTTSDLETIRQERDATVVQPGPAPAAAAPAAPALEEAQMADIIKQSIIKTFRKLDYK